MWLTFKQTTASMAANSIKTHVPHLPSNVASLMYCTVPPWTTCIHGSMNSYKSCEPQTVCWKYSFQKDTCRLPDRSSVVPQQPRILSSLAIEQNAWVEYTDRTWRKKRQFCTYWWCLRKPYYQISLDSTEQRSVASICRRPYVQVYKDSSRVMLGHPRFRSHLIW